MKSTILFIHDSWIWTCLKTSLLCSVIITTVTCAILLVAQSTTYRMLELPFVLSSLAMLFIKSMSYSKSYRMNTKRPHFQTTVEYALFTPVTLIHVLLQLLYVPHDDNIVSKLFEIILAVVAVVDGMTQFIGVMFLADYITAKRIQYKQNHVQPKSSQTIPINDMMSVEGLDFDCSAPMCGDGIYPIVMDRNPCGHVD
jgi:hypothetical protein